MATECNKIFLR